MDTDPHIVPTLLACLTLTATAMWALAAQVRTRPRDPDPGPTAMDLGGETPAVVGLVTGDFVVSPAAVPATVVDLAARGWLSIEEVAGGNVVIRLSDRAEPLQPYERRVLDHLRSLAVDGVVPAAAMTTGPEAASDQWWRSFRREVVVDAQARGLSRDRWSRRLLAPIWVGTVASGALLWLADRLGDAERESGGIGASGWLWGVGVVGTGALAFWAFSVLGRGLQRDTDAGLAAASRWLGVREHMATVGDFRDKPAAAVTLWDRHLAHAVALGLAPTVVAQLPLGAEDDRHAWSRASGRWRRVRVRYPWLRPGYGQHPVVAALGAIVAGAIAGVGLRFAVQLRSGDVLADSAGDTPAVVDLFALVLGTVAGAVLVWNVVKLAFAAGDLVRSDRREGTIVRRRVRRGAVGLTDVHGGDDRVKERFFAALDTGESADIAAYRVRRAVFDQLTQGQVCLLVVTPRLRYVRRVEPATTDNPRR